MVSSASKSRYTIPGLFVPVRHICTVQSAVSCRRLCKLMRGWFETSRPHFRSTRPRFPPTARIIINKRYSAPAQQQSKQQSEMSRYTIKDNTNCLNTTNSINVQNYLTFADDRSQLLTWLSPLDPGLRHWDIQERRVNNVGEWLIEKEEFRRWCGLGGEDEGDKAVLFCYGDPGVGKTFIR